MGQLGVWCVLCLVLAWWVRRRPIYGVVAVVALRTLVPSVAGHLLTGQSRGFLGCHPATWLVMVLFGVQLLLNSKNLTTAAGRHPYVLLVTMVFGVGAFGTSYLEHSGGTRLLGDQIVGPFLTWWLIVAAAQTRRDVGPIIRTTVLILAAAESTLAVVQKFVGRVIFFQTDYLTFTWFSLDRFDRWLGTADSPLALSLMLCLAAGFTVGLRSTLLRSGLLILFLTGTLIAQGRTGTVLICLIILYSVLRSRVVLWARLLSVLLLAVAGYLIFTSSLVAGITARLSNDTGSTDARLRAFAFVANTLTSYLAVGSGLTSSYRIAREAGLHTSLESSYLMYVIDVGLILATAYFGLQVAILFRYGRQRSFPGVTLAATVAVGLQHTFSAVAGTNLIGTLVWSALALVMIGTYRPVAVGAGDEGDSLAVGQPAGRLTALSDADRVSASHSV